MGLLNRIQNLLSKRKRIDVGILPSQGFFYDRDFTVQIKKAEEEEIREYEQGYDKENLGSVLHRLKSIVRKNTVLPEKWTFNDLRSIDVVFLFLEIVKFTKNGPVSIGYWDDETGEYGTVDFCTENFNYYVPSRDVLDCWNAESRCFEIDGYSFTLPSIGIENSLTAYLIEKSYEPGAERFNDYSYNFTYFLGRKSWLNFDEIDNLIQIFNQDIDQEEKDRIDAIVADLLPMQRYSLKKGSRVIDMSSKLNLEKIWK